VNDWRSYDDVADIYERIHAPRLAQPARDLVEIAGATAGTRVLDIGTGTGVAAQAALERGATVVGIDESVGMLSVGRSARPTAWTAAAEAIDLPFRDGSFDAVIANFVIAHFTKYQTALFDMTRVLRSGGRMALSAWADVDDDLTRTWLNLVEGVVPRPVLQSSLAEALPWRERFRDPDALQEALTDAGLRSVRAERRTYQFQYALDEYVDGMSTWATGRLVRSMLPPAAFASFLERAKRTFSERFADPVNDFREVLFVTGVKP
jgi:ubiquinone/menaquinone biosynthesis C-methylase UbiE